jgi:hypothetical protein
MSTTSDRFESVALRDVEAAAFGEAALERGEYLTHEQVGNRLDRLFRS